jgi:hypothetical protein
MEKYGCGSRSSMADRAFWMQAWNGGSYPIDRVGRGFFMIQNLSACLSGGLQPDVLRKIAASAADDGLIQRIIPTICRNKVPGFDEPTPAAVRAYDDLVERLYAMEPPEPDNAFVRFGGGDMTVEFDDGAQRVREEVEKKHFDLTSLECMGKKMTSHVAKYDGYFARLCLIWHCVENSGEVSVPGYVTEDTARRVAKFMHQFLLPHAAEFYNMLGLADDHDRLSNVASFILAKELTKVTRREVQRGDRSMRGLTDRETDAVFEQLEALGWLKRTRGPYHGRGDHWLVNPRCHELFRQRAEREAERRAQQQAVLAEFFGNHGRVLNGD